ncbi:MAG: MBL fold metallo-hydrolase [Phycisphaerae bacterium]
MARMMHKKLGGIEIVGFSLAGEETVIAVPEYNVCFDVGRAPREIISIDNVCISHGHMDHAAGVAYYFSQRTFVGISPGRVIVHRDLAQAIQKLMDVWSDIEGHPSPGVVHGVRHLEDVPIRRDMFVRPFTVNHCDSALGYTLIEVRHKLKEEFIGKSGPELVALKRKGVEIEHQVDHALLTYTGDTAVGRFLDLGFVRRSRAVLLECTFFDRDHVARARAGRHIHVDDLKDVLSSIPDAQIMLTHVSRRTDLRFARGTLERSLAPADMERVSFLMDRPPRPGPSRTPHREGRIDASTRITTREDNTRRRRSE